MVTTLAGATFWNRLLWRSISCFLYQRAHTYAAGWETIDLTCFSSRPRQQRSDCFTHPDERVPSRHVCPNPNPPRVPNPNPPRVPRTPIPHVCPEPQYPTCASSLLFFFFSALRCALYQFSCVLFLCLIIFHCLHHSLSPQPH